METIEIVFSIVLLFNIVFFILMYRKYKYRTSNEYLEDTSDVYLTDEYKELLRKNKELLRKRNESI